MRYNDSMENHQGLYQAPPEIIEWFRKLTDKQLVEFFYQAVQGRRISGDGEDYHEEHLVLANASRMRDYLNPKSESEELGPWENWELQLLALYDRNNCSDRWSDDAPICQMGRCTCNPHEVLCYDKYATCPICGSPVYGT